MKQFLITSILILTSLVGHTAPPPAHEVFQVSAHIIDPNSFSLDWVIKPGFFLYRDKLHLTQLPDEPFHLGDIHYPKAVKKTDNQGNVIKVYRNQTTLTVSILADRPGEGFLNIAYQGCSDDGFCYPPETKQLKVAFNGDRKLMDVTIEPMANTVSSTQIANTETVSLHQLFSTNNWALIFISFYGFGLLLAFTPCVLPMIPVLSSIIIGQGKKLSTRKAFFLSLSYILSMATTYAIVGAFVALMGSNLQIVMQSYWAIASFSIIFILLSMSMFGLYDLRMPSAWQTKLTKLSHSKAGGFYLGAAIMGCLSTLILSPCVTAPLIGALGYIANTGDVARGSMALFFLGLGIGTPLLLIGTSAGKWIPKTGHWMNTIKSFFGLLLLGVAINLLSRILPPIYTMGLWASLLIFTGIYSGALTRAKDNLAKFTQGVGIICLVYGILILIGASQGGEDPLLPLARNTPMVYSAPKHSTLKTLSAVQRALENAKGKPVLMDFYADWCASCKHIDATTLQDPAVATALDSFVFIKVDVTDNHSESQALLHYFNVIAPPTFLFFNRSGEEVASLRLVGEITPKVLLNALDDV